MIECLDSYNDAYLAKAGFEVEPGSFKRARDTFFADMRTVTNLSQITSAYKQGMAFFENCLRKNPPTRFASES